MFSAVNNTEKSMFIHVLKNGGTYVKNVLSKYYKFGGTISIDLKNSARIRSPMRLLQPQLQLQFFHL